MFEFDEATGPVILIGNFSCTAAIGSLINMVMPPSPRIAISLGRYVDDDVCRLVARHPDLTQWQAMHRAAGRHRDLALAGTA